MISPSLLADFDLECVVECVVMGLKNLVKRRGVIDGGFRGLLLLTPDGGAVNGEDGISIVLS